MAKPLLFPRNLLIGALAVAALYAWWVSSQYQRLNALNQRELADVASELRSTVENAFTNITNFKPVDLRGAPACDFDFDQPYLELVPPCSSEKSRWTNPRLKLAGGIGIEADRYIESAPQSTPAPIPPSSAPPPLAFRFRTDLLFAELPFTERFERVFVVDRNGRVVYQEDPSLRRRIRLLRWGERRFRDSRAGETHGLRVQSMSELIGKDAVAPWPRLQAVSDRTMVSLGGNRFVLYSHPLAIGSDGELVLVGVVPVSTVVRQALAFDTRLVATLVFLALVAVLGFPFIKLATLHAHERFKVSDVRWQYISCAALLAVFAFAVLAIDGYSRWVNAADRGIRRIADQLAKGLTGEVREVRRVLDAYDHTAAALIPSLKCGAERGVIPDWFNEPDEAAALGFPRQDDLYLDQLTWVNDSGDQIWKITSDFIGEKVSVARRSYYQAVRDGALFELAGESGPFFIGPDWSITDGKFYTFVSIRSRLSDQWCGVENDHDESAAAPGDPFVAVATVRLLSVDRQPLPDGYGFAVITRDGRVLYHSDRRLSLRENFFDELTGWADARSVVYSGAPAVLGTRYRERPHRIYFQPLGVELERTGGAQAAAAAWYLAVFRDVSTEQTVISRAFLISLPGPLLFLLLMIVMAIWAAGSVSKRLYGRSDHWLWPQRKFEPLYRRLTLIFAGVLAACLVLAALAGPWAFVVMPPLMIASGLGAFALDPSRHEERRPLTKPRWHVLHFTLLALGLIVVPAAAMFDATLRHEFGTLITTEQRSMADQVEDGHRDIAAEARAERVPLPHGVQAKVERARRQSPTAWPEPFDTPAPPIESPTTLRLLGAHEVLDRWLPFESEAAMRLRYQLSRRQYAPPGLFGWPIGWMGICGLVVIGAAFVAWLRWTSTHVLHSKTRSRKFVSPERAAAAWEACTLEERHVMMHAAQEGIANPRQNDVVRRLIARGMLQFTPELRPSSPSLQTIIGRALEGAPVRRALEQWESPHDGHNWHDARTLLFVSLGVVALLVATQPGLPSELAAVAGGVATVGGAGLKLRDVVAEWLVKTRKT